MLIKYIKSVPWRETKRLSYIENARSLKVNVPAPKVVRHGKCMEERIGAYRVLVGKPEGRIPLGTRRQIWKDNINMDFQ